MGPTWAGRLAATLGFCLVVSTARGEEPSRSYIFFPPPQPGSPDAGTSPGNAATKDPADTAASGPKKNGTNPASEANTDAKTGPPRPAGEPNQAGNPSKPPTEAASAGKDSAGPRSGVTEAEIKAARAELADRLKALPGSADKDATAATKALREVLEERLSSFDEWEKAVKARNDAEHPDPSPEKQVADLKADLERTKSSLEQIAKDPDSLIPAVFRTERGQLVADAARTEMKEAIESANNDVKEWKEKKEKAQPDPEKPADSRLVSLRSDRNKLQQSAATLKARRGERDAAIAAAKTKEARELARDRRQNLEWETRVEAERLQAVEARIALEAKNIELAAIRLDVAKAHEELSKKTLQRMQTHYSALVAREESDLQRAAAREEKRAAKSDDPLERFRARRNAELLEMEVLVKKGDNAIATAALPKETEEEEKTRGAREDLAGVKKLLDDGRVSQLDALRLNNDFRRIGPERERIVKNELATTTAHLTTLENALSTVELALVNGQRDDRYELDTLLERLPAPRHAEAIRVADELEKRRTALLGKRKENLETLIKSAEKTLNEIEARVAILDEEYGFIRTHIFWVRDQEPLGTGSLMLAERELIQLARALFRIAAETGDRSAWGRISVEFVLAAVLAVVMPWPLLRAQRWLRAVEASRCETRTTLRDLTRFLHDLLAASLWPLYIGNLAYVARQAPWPRGAALLSATIIAVGAAATFAVNFTRAHLQPGGWAEIVLRLPRAALRQVRQAYYALIAISVLLLVPGGVFTQGMIVASGRPVLAPAVSRFLDLAFGVAVGGIVLFLARGNSPLVEWLVQTPERWGWLNRRRRVLVASLLSFIAAVVSLDAFGYSFTAHRLGVGAIQSVLIAALCWGLYRLLVEAIDHQAWRWIRPGQQAHEPGTASDASGQPTDLAGRLRRLVGYIVPLVGLGVGAWVWDIDGSLFRFLGEQVILQFSDGKDFQGKVLVTAVTVGDLAQSVLFLFVTAVIWRHLSTCFAVAVFPRMPDDPGVRFAVLTLCRYGVLAVGLLTAMMSVHVGPQQLGMALAALGVGLGFGLQEIVSNFVCGIILLLERPIRVGDIVTVSDMTGKVDRINIRATTIINGDNQSMLVPNRAFITGNLVNWTLKDKVIRTTVRVKVGHGNDPDRVTDLLLTIAREDPDVLRNPVPAALFEDFAESAMAFVLHVYVPDPSLGGRVKHRLLTQVQHRFKEAGIAIPVPSQEFIVKPAPDAAVSFFTAPGGFHRIDPGATVPPPPHRVLAGHLAEDVEETRRGVDE
ncbi:MAG: mechanosensitive ion channel [Isosphaeraceae bacterium]|nr:mechanosensitive ion channel [Isosphaeraceae bacterium]